MRNTMGRMAAVAGVIAGLAGCNDGSPTTPRMDAQALDQAFAGTARYADIAVALAEGFVQASPCEQLAGSGAMGHHYLNPARMDGRLVLSEPEVLLYIPEGGGMRLVGIEYILPIIQDGRPFFGPGAPTNPGPVPTLFGQSFQGPMAGHNPAMPWHHDLHVWMYRDNPAGYFAQYNPSLSCP
jgi:hypothetical protein